MSRTHLAFGRSAVKSRLSRSGNFGAVLSCRVSPLRRRIRRATSPWRRIDSATAFSLTFHPVSTRSACSRGERCTPRAFSNAAFTARSTVSRRRSRGVPTVLERPPEVGVPGRVDEGPRPACSSSTRRGRPPASGAGLVAVCHFPQRWPNLLGGPSGSRMEGRSRALAPQWLEIGAPDAHRQR